MAALSRAAMVLTMMGLAATSALSQPSLISMTTDVPLPDGLSYDFHALSCNNLQNMVREAVQGAMARDAGVVPGLLRLFFHDCFPQVHTFTNTINALYLKSIIIISTG